ncbi:MAG: hypothetical protein V3U80_02770 [Flavobacteriaceae bacterium]
MNEQIETKSLADYENGLIDKMAAMELGVEGLAYMPDTSMRTDVKCIGLQSIFRDLEKAIREFVGKVEEEKNIS